MKSKKKTNTVKFTDEELSRVLSHAHELTSGGYDRAGENTNKVGCLIQARDNLSVTWVSIKDWRLVDAFDAYCPGKKTPENLLKFLRKQGVV